MTAQWTKRTSFRLLALVDSVSTAKKRSISGYIAASR
jgi:hypothetical protein